MKAGCLTSIIKAVYNHPHDITYTHALPLTPQNYHLILNLLSFIFKWISMHIAMDSTYKLGSLVYCFFQPNPVSWSRLFHTLTKLNRAGPECGRVGFNQHSFHVLEMQLFSVLEGWVSQIKRECGTTLGLGVRELRDRESSQEAVSIHLIWALSSVLTEVRLSSIYTQKSEG